MSSRESNSRSLVADSSSITFQRRIAPQIAERIQTPKPIAVRITCADPGLTAWLSRNLSSISVLNITSSVRGAQRRNRYYRKKVCYE